MMEVKLNKLESLLRAFHSHNIYQIHRVFSRSKKVSTFFLIKWDCYLKKKLSCCSSFTCMLITCSNETFLFKTSFNGQNYNKKVSNHDFLVFFIGHLEKQH